MPDTLAAALARHAIELPTDRIEGLERYCALLWEWNAKINLTRHTDYEKFVARDVVDSTVIAEQLNAAERVLDVGTGGGVPGVVLAIVRPDLEVSLAESVAKKARAVEQIVAGLGLEVPVYHARAEDLLTEKSFDTLVARAVAPLPKLLTWFAPHWGSFERLLAVKGPAWVEERADARQRNLLKQIELRKVATWPLPDSDSESVLLEMRAR